MNRNLVHTSSALLAAASLLAGGAYAVPQQGPYPCGPGYGWQQGPAYFQGQWTGRGYGPGYGFGGGPGGGQQFMGRFGTIDQDHNGVVTAEEAAGNIEVVFNLMDWNEDDRLTYEEFMSVRMGPGAGYNSLRTQAALAEKERRFQDMDTDEDGQVDRWEFVKAGEARFLASDADEDGEVTPWEFRASRWRF